MQELPKFDISSTKIAKSIPLPRLKSTKLPKVIPLPGPNRLKLANCIPLARLESSKRDTLAGGTSPGTFTMEEPPHPVAEIMGELGGQLPPPQFNKTRKFSEEVGNFEGGIETAVKKRVAVEKERVSTLNEQKRCSRSFCSVFLSFYALTFLSKREESCWVQVANSIDISERRLSVIGRGVLSQ